MMQIERCPFISQSLWCRDTKLSATSSQTRTRDVICSTNLCARCRYVGTSYKVFVLSVLFMRNLSTSKWIERRGEFVDTFFWRFRMTSREPGRGSSLRWKTKEPQSSPSTSSLNWVPCHLGTPSPTVLPSLWPPRHTARWRSFSLVG